MPARAGVVSCAVRAHAAVAAAALDETLTWQVLDDVESAPIDDRLRATLIRWAGTSRIGRTATYQVAAKRLLKRGYQ